MTERIVFANTLRGFAAVAVLFSHFAGIFWIMNPAICDLMGVPPLTNLPALPAPLGNLAEYCIVLGQFGVGIFFIVSGLVIPFSLTPKNKLNFLRRRAWRIYPVYIVGFLFVMTALHALSQLEGTVYRFTTFEILAHLGVITRAPLDVTRIDGISWTLEVEIYFYLVLCLLGNQAMKLKIKGFMLAIIAVAVAASLIFKFSTYLVGVQVASGMLLLLGMAYNALINKRITLRQLLILHGLVGILIPTLWLLAAKPMQFTLQWMGGYLLAITVFYICYTLRNRFTDNRILAHLADISYPLYVVHALFGYAIMYVLTKSGSGPLTAIFAASLAAWAIAALLHLIVELPALKKSKSKDLERLSNAH